jgi:acyl carrier protein
MSGAGTTDQSRVEILDKLVADVGDELSAPVTPTTPLISSGLLRSVQTAWLLKYVEREFGVRVRLDRMALRNFETLESVTTLILELRSSAG